MHADLTRRGFLALAAASAATLAACRTRAARDKRVPRLGLMNGAMFPEMTSAFEDELHRLGYVPGENLILEKRLSGADRSEMPRHAAELAAMELDVIFAGALPHLLALREAGATVPTVVGTAPGIVLNGFAATAERPGGHVTGMDELPPGLTARRLEWLKAFAPRVTNVALLSTTPGKGHAVQLADAEQAAARLGLAVTAFRASTPPELAEALEAIGRGGHDGLLNFQGGLSLVLRQQIVDFANARGMPAIYQSRMFVDSGGLLAWAPDQLLQFRIAARNVDRILRGTPVGEIPLSHPERYYLSFNRETAAKLGLVPTPALLAQVDAIVG